MMGTRVTVGSLIGVVVALGLTARPVGAQGPLALAKAHYALAAYEEALSTLASAGPSSSMVEMTEVVAYRAYCLLALGRMHEARALVESLVLIDPFFRPPVDQVSPRVRTFFDDVRFPLLDDAAWQVYGAAREAFERQDLATAAEGFRTAIRLAEELPAPRDASVADLETLAHGFLDLTDRMLAVPPTETEPSSPPVDPDTGVSDNSTTRADDDPGRVYSDADPGVTMPEVVSRPLPPWVPPPGAGRQTFSGVIELIVSQEGKVESSHMLDSVEPLYDSLLMSAARTWQFRPATKDGVAVRYRYRLAVRMGESQEVARTHR
ncbi:MAG TPA: hypothetical protein VLA20_12735 [Vicinamibacterales bacterium]|nr:hypothetical protein [Vicinamibacterales bacterium]